MNGSDDENSMSTKIKFNQLKNAEPIPLSSISGSDKVDSVDASSSVFHRSRSNGSLADSSTSDLVDHEISNKLLQQAFTSLSLTDKCALSLTLSQHQSQNSNQHNNAFSNLKSTNLTSHVENDSWFKHSSSWDTFHRDGKSHRRQKSDSSSNNSIACNGLYNF